tara:strand:- start:1057 stop:1203 length:147 start_codon:yes stop_codon:yes gene_type:complete
LRRILKNKKKYTSPKISKIGDAKKIIKDALIQGTGDSFPGASEILAST